MIHGVIASNTIRSLQVLLDIGAGQGLFSLAAAARGHRAIALEASPLSADPLQVCKALMLLRLSFCCTVCRRRCAGFNTAGLHTLQACDATLSSC